MRTRNLVIWMALAVLICALFSANQVAADRKTASFQGRPHSLDFSKSVPANLNYQGFLSDATDSMAVTDTLEMTFRLYNAESGGSELWSETHAQVPVNDGVFSVLLGEYTALSMGLFNGSTLWLQTEVGAEVLSPRKPLVSVAYGMRSHEADHAANADYAIDADHAVNADNAADALHAAEADHAVHADTALFSQPDADWTIDGNDMYSGVSGNVGIGTASPAEKLDVAGAVQMTAFRLPSGAIAGHVLTCSAGGTGTWQPPAAVSDGDWTISGNDLYSAVPGNIGIGTNAPERLLHIYGGSAGTVTSNSAAKLVIEGDNTTTMSFLTPNTYPQGIQFGDSDDPAIGWIMYDNSGDRLRLGTNNSDKVTILNNGNMGIGISSPATKLDVNGEISATGGSSADWNTAYSWGDHAAAGYLELDATNNSAAITWWNSTSTSNVLSLNGNTPLAAIYCRNEYAGNTWGLSAGLGSSSAGTSSYGVFGFNHGTGYGVYGRSYNASGTGVRGINNSNSNFGDLGTPSYGAYGEHNSGNYGYLGGSGAGVYGSHVDGNYGYIATSANGVYANLVTTDPGDYAIYGYGTDATTENGIGYSNTSTLGGVKGYNLYGNPYTFGVAGYSWLDDNRSGSCLGSRYNGTVWGSMGYQNSGGTEYGGYFTSYTSGGGKGEVSIGIGMGSWGDLFGADIHGQIYGIFTEGGNYGLYSHGAIFRDDLDVHLQHTKNNSTAVLYTNVSTDVTVQTSGFGTLSQGSCNVEFDDNFTNAVSSQEPIIVTVTPHGNTNGVYISDVKSSGFTVVENNQGKSTVRFSFIAIGHRAGYENPQLPQDVISSDYVHKLSRGLNADVNTEVDGEGLYYENGHLYVGSHPSTLPDPYKPTEELDAPEEMKTRPAEIITDTQDETANGRAPSAPVTRPTQKR